MGSIASPTKHRHKYGPKTRKTTLSLSVVFMPRHAQKVSKRDYLDFLASCVSCGLTVVSLLSESLFVSSVRLQ
eukprot:4179134-Amphidinium_carterae.1